jgi:hypothetical protein
MSAIETNELKFFAGKDMKKYNFLFLCGLKNRKM